MTSTGTKPKEIVYVEGWPNEIAPSFDYLRSLNVAESYLDKGDLYKMGDVWSYEGSLERKDFEAIGKIFGSDQSHELKDGEKFLERLKYALSGEQPLTYSWSETRTITPPPKKVQRKGLFGRLFGLHYYVKQKPYEKKTDHVNNVEVHASSNLFGELEKIIGKHGMPDSVSAQSLALREAEENGEYYSIGEYLKFAKPDNADITVFVDKEPRGTIYFVPDEKKKRSYQNAGGAYSGEYYPTNIKVIVNGKEITMGKNMWCISQANITLLELDRRIRKEILNESETQKFIGGC